MEAHTSKWIKRKTDDGRDKKAYIQVVKQGDKQMETHGKAR